MLARAVPFVRLTRPDGRKVLVNIGAAEIIAPSGHEAPAHSQTQIVFDTKFQYVQESFDEVCALLGLTE